MPESLQLDDNHDPEESEPGAPQTDDDKRRAFLALARERFRESADGEFVLRQKMLEDRRFASGGAYQWLDEQGRNQQNERWAMGKPAVTANRIPSYTRQVTNSIRESRPAIQYVGVDDDHDPELAEVLQGLARHVEQNSMADIAYETAAEHQVEGGRGWFYFRHDYVHDETDELDIFMERVRNPDTVYPDVIRQKFDYSDARYLHHIEDMPLDEFKRQFPKESIASLAEFSSIGDQNWVFRDRVRVSHYYYIEHVAKTLVVLQPEAPPPSGMPGQPGPMPPGQPPTAGPTPPSGPPPAAKKRFLEDLTEEEKPRVMLGPDQQPMVLRQVMVPQVMYARIHAAGILDGNEKKTAGRRFPGRYIPYVPVLGSERDLNGEVDLRGMVRDMREAQQAVNFWQSALTEAIGKVTHGTWIIAEGQVTDGEAGNKRLWETAHLVPRAYLPYKPLALEKTHVSPPRWESQAPEIQSIVVALQIAENTLRACAGFYGMESDEKKPEQSGIAIQARQLQGERGAGHFHGNLGRAIRHGGRILLHMFPEVYDTARIKRINGIDDEEKAVMVYSGNNKPQETKKDQAGQAIKAFDLSSAGRYDVRISIGPSMATKRQEATSQLSEIIKNYPPAGVLLDLLVKQMDFPGANEAATRLKNMLPPQALGDDGDPAAQLMKLQSQNQQYGQMVDALTKQVNQLHDDISSDRVKNESAERIKAMELKSKELQVEHTLLIELEIAKLKAQLDATKTAAQLEAGAQQQQQQFGHDAEQKQSDRQHEHVQNRQKLDAGMAQTHMKGVQSSQQTSAEHEQEKLITDMEHSQQEHMVEIQASHAKEQQATDIKAQQEQAQMAQKQGPAQA